MEAKLHSSSASDSPESEGREGGQEPAQGETAHFPDALEFVSHLEDGVVYMYPCTFFGPARSPNQAGAELGAQRVA